MTARQQSGVDPYVEGIYEALEGDETAMEWAARDGVRSQGTLTVYNEQSARNVAAMLEPRISGRRVVEIGAGVGLLAIELARYADVVWAIEADPAWSWVFTKRLYQEKPKNLVWIFGNANELPPLDADVGVVLTHSDREGLLRLARRHARTVVDFYREYEPVTL